MKRITLIAAMLGITIPLPAIAQISSDGSTGTIVTPNSNLFNITGGTTVGGRNLFHSFDRFDVPAQGVANFLNDPGIVNIFSRITGGKVSEIDGVLRSQGNANFFLINPNGIIFNRNAQLNIGGSFVATTADAIEFPGSATFAIATPVPSENTLLAVDPSAFLFKQPIAGRIQNDAVVGLQVPDSRSLLLVGGDISLDNGKLNALEGHIELGGLANAGSIGLSINGSTFSLVFPDDRTLANVSLNNNARVSVRGAKNGSLVITANQLTATNGGRLVAGTEGAGNGGTITIKTNELNLSGSGIEPIDSDFGLNGAIASGIYNQVTNNASGSAGDIFINTKQFNLSADALVLSNAVDGTTGNAGNIWIQTETLNASSEAAIGSITLGQGKGGILSIKTNTLNLTEGAFFSTETFGEKDAGLIDIQASNAINISGTGAVTGNSSALYTSTLGTGRAGNIIITTDQLSLSDGALIDTRTAGSGQGGNITINTRTLDLLRGAQFLAATQGSGQGGNITVQATGLVTIAGQDPGFRTRRAQFDRENVRNFGDQSGMTASTSGNVASSRGGSLTIQAQELMIGNGGIISNDTFGVGETGKVTLELDQTLSIKGGTISSQVKENAIGRSNGLSIFAQDLNLTDGGQIITSSTGTGDAGAIEVQADQVKVSGTSPTTGISSGLFTDTLPINITSAGRGGDIIFRTNLFRVADGAILNTGTSGPKAGGNITINTDTFEVVDGGQLTASTQGSGKAGDITINATGNAKLIGFDPNFNLRLDRFPNAVTNNGARSGLVSNVNATAIRGQGGTIQVNAKNLFLIDGAGISTSTFGQGNAGNISLQVIDNIISTSQFAKQNIVNGIFGSVESNAVGKGGNITIAGRFMTLQNGTQITTATSGKTTESQRSDAGDIRIKLTERLSIEGDARIQSSSLGAGNAGSILLNAREILLRSNSKITTDSRGGNGGNITLNAAAIAALENSDILAFAPAGTGGSIQFNTRAFLSSPLYRPAPPTLDRNELDALFTNNRVDVNASGIVSGTITGIPNVTFLQNNLTQLSQRSIDTDALLPNRCVARDRKTGAFYITGTGGLPTRPDDVSTYSIGTVQSVIEPQGVYPLTNGELILSRECS